MHERDELSPVSQLGLVKISPYFQSARKRVNPTASPSFHFNSYLSISNCLTLGYFCLLRIGTVKAQCDTRCSVVTVTSTSFCPMLGTCHHSSLLLSQLQSLLEKPSLVLIIHDAKSFHRAPFSWNISHHLILTFIVSWANLISLSLFFTANSVYFLKANSS